MYSALCFDESAFLNAISNSFKNYQNYGARSSKKLEPLHKYLSDAIECIFNESDYQIYSLGREQKELSVKGKYYAKKVDIAVTYKNKEKAVFCLGVKFITSNYKQNANNYFEGMIGETANIQRAGIPYAQLIILRHQTPYYEKDLRVQKDKKAKKIETISNQDIEKYISLAGEQDNVPHRPFAIAVAIVDIDETNCMVKAVPWKALGMKKRVTDALQNELSVSNLFNSIIELKRELQKSKSRKQ